MNANLLRDFRTISSANGRYLTMDDLIEAARSGHTDRWGRVTGIGRMVWDKCCNRREMVETCASWPGWPTCQCTCCGCDEAAVTTDDGGVEVCEKCAEYTTDDDGCVVCSKDDRTETVTESCGAGNQQRSYVRLKPPEMPESDATGEYCLYWATCGDDNHVVSRYATRDEAEQAVAAKDWPRPGDNTNYLCGYEARQLVDGQWLGLERE